MTSPAQRATLERSEGEVRLLFHCPGCQMLHGPRVEGEAGVWQWNGSLELPTLSPSILVSGKRPRPGQDPASGEPWPDFVCHSFVRDGRIQFLGDCTHALAGQTVDLPGWEDGWAD